MATLMKCPVNDHVNQDRTESSQHPQQRSHIRFGEHTQTADRK